MKKILLFFVIVLPINLLAFEKLSDDYCVYYGNKDSDVTIIQYYSFTCPHCVTLFRKEFQKIKEAYIDTQQVNWVFHPIPVDLLTVQGMECLSKLEGREKRIFLEAMLEELIIEQPKVSATLMQKGMEVLGKPIPDLQEKRYLAETGAFNDAFLFLKQDNLIEAVPAAEVNGVLYPGQVPDYEFIERVIKKEAI